MRTLDGDYQKKQGHGAVDGGRVPVQMRHQRIMDAFNLNGFVSVTDIAEKIGVSTMTIRRDLVTLEKLGKIARTHGGAVALRDSDKIGVEDEESAFDRRKAQNADAKMRIAQAAAALVESGQSVGLDAGTTVLTAAEHLSHRDDLHFVTANLRAALALTETKSRVYVVGGEVRVPELSVVGSSAIKTIAGHFLDIVLLGISALDENGIYDFSPEDAEVKKAFIGGASRVAVLCDSSKFEHRALARIVNLDAIDILVTDSAPPARLRAALQAAQVQILVAEASGE